MTKLIYFRPDCVIHVHVKSSPPHSKYLTWAQEKQTICILNSKRVKKISMPLKHSTIFAFRASQKLSQKIEHIELEHRRWKKLSSDKQASLSSLYRLGFMKEMTKSVNVKQKASSNNFSPAKWTWKYFPINNIQYKNSSATLLYASIAFRIHLQTEWDSRRGSHTILAFGRRKNTITA